MESICIIKQKMAVVNFCIRISKEFMIGDNDKCIEIHMQKSI